MNIGYRNERADSNVVTLATAREAAQFPPLARVEAYWDALRNGRAMPCRAELDPRGLAGSLEYTFVLDRIAPGVARMRLAGMHLNDLMGMEVRGMPITAMFLPDARAALQAVLDAVLDTPASARLTLGSDSALTRPKLAAQMVLLPLKDDQGQPTRILGALQARGKIGRGPRRFRIEAQTLTPRTGATLSAPARAEAPAPRVPHSIAPRRPAGRHLTLVHDADGLPL